MTFDELFLANLPHIEKAVAQTCRRYRFQKEEEEDFSSLVKIKLMENDYAVLRKFQGECDLKVYLTVCIKRLMLDHQNHLWGKWRSSTEASRLGEVAVRLEKLLRRDGFSFEEAVAILRINEKVEMSEQELHDLAARLPPKTPPRRMEGDAGLLDLPAQGSQADEGIRQQEQAALRSRALEALQAALQSLSERDRLLFKMKADRLSVDQICRTLGLDRKQLYRRIEKAQKRLRRRLEERDIRKEDIQDMFED
jgi:RNA polymerase sigma factor (sigma-70 family)